MYEPCDFRGSYLPLDGRWGVTPLKGMSGMPTSRSIRSAPPERGMTYGARALWSRSLRSSRRWGKPTTWRRGTGGCRFERGRVRDAHNLTRVDGHPLESRGEIERLMPGSERGCRKSAISATRRQSTLLQARFGGGCALQAHTVQPSGMAALIKRSQQSGTESCAVYGNVLDEA
jgi:hypothetical protein